MVNYFFCLFTEIEKEESLTIKNSQFLKEFLFCHGSHWSESLSCQTEEIRSGLYVLNINKKVNILHAHIC